MNRILQKEREKCVMSNLSFLIEKFSLLEISKDLLRSTWR